MTWDNPWFVGGGALHSPEIARLLAFAAFGGGEGIVQGPDLKVTALPVPTSAVRVLTGAAAINNRSQGGAQQAYAGRLFTADDLNIAGTGSASGRNDLIVARVEDPFMAGEPWDTPADPETGHYIFSRVIANVPDTAVATPQAASAYLASQGYSAIPLGAVILPANTTTITGSLIRDLRFVARPRKERHLVRVDGAATSNSLSATTMTNWPGTSVTLQVPTWATEVIIRSTVSGIAVVTGGVGGALRLVFSPVNGALDGFTKNTVYTEQTVGSRVQYELSDQIAIPASARGTTRAFYPQGQKWVGAAGGSGFLQAGDGTQVVYDIEFIESPA